MVHAQTRDAVRGLLRGPAGAVTFLLVAVVGLSACGHSGDEGTGYLAKRADRIVFVEWTQAQGATSGAAHLNGSATLALIDTKKFNLLTDVASFTGTMQGSAVALALSKPLDASSSWSGTVSGELLTLSYTGTGGASVSLTLHSASQDDYNSAIASEQQALADLKSGKTAATTADKGKAGVDKWSAIVQKDLDKVAADAAAVTPAVGAVTSANDRADADKESARRLLAAGVKVTINTDDPGLMGIDLTHELKVARDALGFTTDDLRAVTSNAIEASFVPDEVKAGLRARHFGWVLGYEGLGEGFGEGEGFS